MEIEKAKTMREQIAKYKDLCAQIQTIGDDIAGLEEVAKAIGLDTYSRSDFLLNEKNEIFCLEANTLPGMTPLLDREGKPVISTKINI